LFNTDTKTAIFEGTGDLTKCPNGNCACDEKLETALTDLQLKLEKQFAVEKRKALKDLEERVWIYLLC
jgi:hypothetical protein